MKFISGYEGCQLLKPMAECEESISDPHEDRSTQPSAADSRREWRSNYWSVAVKLALT